jgi:sulfotransferase
MSGLPRAGTTLLSVLIKQNPRLLLTEESSLADHMRNVHQSMGGKEDVMMGNNVSRHQELLRGMLKAYYAQDDSSHVIDKCRHWAAPYFIRLLNEATGTRPRIIIPVRPLAEVVTSILLHLRAHPMGNFVDRQMLADDFLPFWRKELDDARVDYLLRPGAMLDMAMLGIDTALKGEADADFMLFTYDELVEDASLVLDRIHEFIGAEPFKYDLTELSNTTQQKDAEVLGLPGFHDVRSEISRTSVSPENVLSDYALERCSTEDFWTVVVDEYAGT